MAGRRFTGIELQAEHADLERLRVAIRKPSLASLEVAADRTLGIVIVITLVGGYAPIERLLVSAAPNSGKPKEESIKNPFDRRKAGC